MLVRSAVEAGKRIEEIIKLVEHDLDLVTSEGAIIQTNQFLMSKSSPFLKNILTEMSSPVRLHLPEISAVALRHLINILQKGYSTGQGSGDSIVKEMKIAAKVLGFEKFPALVFIVGRNPPENISCDNVQQFPQREVEADRIEDGDIEVLADQLLEDQTQDLEEREPSGLNSAGPLLVSNIQNILQDIESDTNEGTSQEPAADETNEASSSKETPKIIFSTGNNKNKDGKKMLRVRRIETLLNPVQNPKPAAHYQGVLSKKRCQVKFTDIANNNFEESSSGALLADHSHNSINKTCGMDMNSNNETPIVPLSPSHGNKRKISRIQSMENPMTRDIRHKEKIVQPCDHEIHDYHRASQAEEQWIRMINQSNKCRVEILDQTNHWSQEVTEITPNVLKVEGDDHGNQPMIHCGVCRKAFTNAGSLLSHSLKHDEYIGERKCTMCTFQGTRTTLLTHTRVKHTKEKLFHCTMCPKTFSSCSTKKSHEKAEKMKKKFWN